jgi:hypothetical protein
MQLRIGSDVLAWTSAATRQGDLLRAAAPGEAVYVVGWYKQRIGKSIRDKVEDQWDGTG